MTSSRLTDIRIRVIIYRVIMAVALVALVGQLWRLQIVRGDYYQAAADVNRFRLEESPAPRGIIYDRRGYILARNMPQVRVSVIPAYLPEDPAERRRLLYKLADLLNMPFANPPMSPALTDDLRSMLEPEGQPKPSVLSDERSAPALGITRSSRAAMELENATVSIRRSSTTRSSAAGSRAKQDG